MNVSKALDALGKTFRIEGNPTTEEEYYENVVVFVGVDDDQVVIESSNPDDLPTWDEVQAKLVELETELPLTELRRQRNILLHDSDWTQNSDSPLSAGTKASWAVYRTQLRDITAIYTSVDDPDFSWPETP